MLTGSGGCLVVLKSQVSLFSVCAGGLVTVVPECCSEPLTGFHASDLEQKLENQMNPPVRNALC